MGDDDLTTVVAVTATTTTTNGFEMSTNVPPKSSSTIVLCSRNAYIYARKKQTNNSGNGWIKKADEGTVPARGSNQHIPYCTECIHIYSIIYIKYPK